MRTRFITTVILLFIFCATLCGCGVFDAPRSGVEVPIQPTAAPIRIYICGAVEREGYYEVEVGTDYSDVLSLAGILPQSVFPILDSSYVDGNITSIVVNYYDGETVYDSINANSALIAARMPIDGLSESIVNKIADYIELHGKIANKEKLKLALGDDYTDNYYKFFIKENDYEEAD